MAYLDDEAVEWKLSPPHRNPDDLGFDDLDDDVDDDPEEDEEEDEDFDDDE